MPYKNKEDSPSSIVLGENMAGRWEERRRFIEAGARRGGVAGMKAAERSWNARVNPPRRRSAASTIVYAIDAAHAKEKVEAKGHVVETSEYLGVNHMGDPYFRVTYRKR